jgi:hypothetical protein
LATLKISPSGGPVGTKMALKGSGFAKGKKYKLTFAGSEIGEFKSTASGTIPQGLKVSVPDAATSGEKGELGAAIPLSVVTPGETGPDATSDFRLQASLVLDVRSAPTGHKVNVTARGLLANEFYSITTILGDKLDVSVGVFTTGPSGSAVSGFTVSSALEPGHYQVQIKNRAGHYMAIREPAWLDLHGYSNASLVPGRPTGPVSQPYCTALVTIPFTNRMAVPTSATVYAVVHKDGKAVRITSSGMNLPALGSAETVICFGTLEVGSYTVSAFAAMTAGAVLSKTFAFPLRITEKPRRRKRPG